jgi:hypothetical protein
MILPGCWVQRTAVQMSKSWRERRAPSICHWIGAKLSFDSDRWIVIDGYPNQRWETGGTVAAAGADGYCRNPSAAAAEIRTGRFPPVKRTSFARHRSAKFNLYATPQLGVCLPLADVRLGPADEIGEEPYLADHGGILQLCCSPRTTRHGRELRSVQTAGQPGGSRRREIGEPGQPSPT